MKTRIFAFILAFIFVIAFVSCGNPEDTQVSATGSWRGNMSYGWGNYNYRHICITAGADHYCYEIEKWYDNEGPGIEIKIENGGFIFVAEGTYHLYSQSSDCGFCK